MPKSLKKQMQHETERINQSTILFWVKRFEEIASSCFRWNGLPETVDARFLESTLYHNGYALFFQEPEIGDYLGLPCAIGEQLSVYGIPKWRNAYGLNEYNCERDDTNSVIIFNNFAHTPTYIDMEVFAQRLYECDRAIDVNIRGQKTPKIITCSENQRLTMENLYMMYEGNHPFIFGDKGLDYASINSIDTASPFVSDKLQIVKRQIFNEALTFLGIENNSTEKAERLVTAETTSNLGAVQIQRLTRLKVRKQAADEINRMFGLNVSVEYEIPLSVDLDTNKQEVEPDE